MKGEWILKEVYFEDGWPSVMRDPIVTPDVTPEVTPHVIDCPRCGHCCPQPEQEPVAWMHNCIEDNVIAHRPSDLKRHPERWTALYKAPRQWVGLTMLDMAELRRNGLHEISDKHFQAIEAKLREKNT